MSKNDDFDAPQEGIIGSLYRALQDRDFVPPRGLRVFLPVAAMVAVFGAVLWYSYPREEERRETLAVPVIKADISSYKTIPADRGGMDIPHKDSTVFQAIRETQEGGEAATVENLLPESEKPLPRAQLFAGLKTDLEEETAAATPTPVPGPEIEDVAATAPPAPAAPAQPAETKVSSAAPSAVPERTPPPAAKPAATAQAPKPVTTAQAKPAPAAPAEDKAPALAKTEPASGMPGDYYVQLGSMRTQEDARKAWKTFQAGFPSQLGKLDLRVQPVDLGSRGTYYRVQGGPIAEAQARSICQAVTKQKPGGCLAVHR